jgi:hypothetical protein
MAGVAMGVLQCFTSRSRFLDRQRLGGRRLELRHAPDLSYAPGPGVHDDVL